MKKAISLVLALAMMLSVFSVNVFAADDVASVDGVGYATLQEAIAEAEGKTVKLLATISGADTIIVNKTITLDLNGYNIENTSASGWALKVDGNSVLTLTDNSADAKGTVKGPKGISVVQGSELIMNGGNVSASGETGAALQVYGSKATMNGGKIEAEYGSVLIYSNGAVRGTFIMNDGELKSVYPNIYANGSDTWDDVDVTINGGTLESETAPIYWPAVGKLTITGGTLTGQTVAYIKSGSLEITGGTLNATGEKKDYAFVESSFRLTGDALAIENVGAVSGYQPIGDVVITGGTFISANASAVASYVANDAAELVTGFVSGGQFSDTSANAYLSNDELVNVKVGDYYVVHKHDTDIEIKAEESTCTEAGKTAGSKCSVCGEIMVEPEDAPLKNHSLKAVDEVAPTYTEEGMKAHEKCDVCGKLFVEDTEVTAADLAIAKLVVVEEGKAEVSTDAVDEAVKEAVDNAKEDEQVIVEIPVVSETEKEVTEVVLPTTSVESVKDNDAALKVETSTATVTLDAVAVNTIVEAAQTAQSATITLVVEEVAHEALTDKQQEAIKDMEPEMVISAEILVNNQVVSDFKGGKAVVALPFEPTEGKGEDYYVVYISDDGKVEKMDTKYVDGHLVVELEHFSEYAVVRDNVGGVDTADHSDIAVLALVMAVSAAVVVFNRKKAF